MSSDDLNLIPKTPDPTYISIAAAVVRGLLQIASGLGFAWALGVTGDQVMMIATALVMLGTLTWSAYQKIQAVRRTRQAAIASAVKSAEATAAAGTPVAIPVLGPSGPGTTARDLNLAEIERIKGGQP
ncbi:MAG: hypothetical protein AB7H90_01545 [Alphaproteobacteria bacterium]